MLLRSRRVAAAALSAALLSILSCPTGASAQGVIRFLARTGGLEPSVAREMAPAAARQLELAAAAEQAFESGDLNQALRAAEALEAHAAETLPVEHWQRRDAALAVETLRGWIAAPQERGPAAAVLAELGQAHRLLAAGNAAAAEPLHRRYVEFCLRACGADHPHTASGQVFLGHALNLLGRHEDAEDAGRKALSAAMRTHGRQHPLTGAAHHLLGIVARERGRDREAVDSSRNAVSYFERLLDGDHPVTLLARRELALALDAHGRLEEAEALHRRLLEALARNEGEDSIPADRSRAELAANLGLQGRHAEAEALDRRSLAVRLRIHGDGHTETALILNNLGVDLHALGRAAEAEGFLRRALSIRRQPGHADGAGTAANLARLLADRGAFLEAESLYRYSAASLVERGAAAGAVLTARGRLASCLKQQGRLEEAEKMLSESLQQSRRSPGKDHAVSRGLEKLIAACWAAQGRHATAEELWRARLEADRRELGDEHPLTAGARSALGACLHRQGRPGDAETHLDRAGETALKAFGAEHPITASILNSLGTAYLAQGKLAEAESVWWQAGASARAVQTASRAAALDPQLEHDRINGSPWRALAVVCALQGEPEKAWQAVEEDLRESGTTLEKGPLDLGAVKSRLREDEAVVAWVSAGRGSAPAVVAPEDWVLILRRGAAEAVKVERGAPADGRDGDDAAAMAELARELRTPALELAPGHAALTARLRARWVAPLLARLEPRAGAPGARSLIVLPAGSTLAIPVEALVPEMQVTSATSVLSVARLRERLQSEPPAARRFLGIGPVAAPPGLRGEGVTLLSGGDASEARLADLAARGELRAFSFIYFAVPALLAARRADGCALELDPPAAVPLSSRDGLVTLQEIRDSWRLDANVVVLGSSDTGAGTGVGGDGYLGFAQAMLESGARGVLVRRWPVPQGPSTLLLDRFHANVATRGMERSAAIDDARRWLRELPAAEAGRPKPYAHPHYWAGLVLVGEP